MSTPLALSELAADLVKQGAQTSARHPLTMRSQRAAASPEEQDEVDTTRLRRALFIYAPSSAPELFGLVRAVVLAITATWDQETRPEIVILLGASYARFYPGALPCGSVHALGARLVASNLADEDERYGDTLINDHLFSRLAILHDPSAAHSSLRWIDPAGDRTIVVLSAEYEAS